MSLPQNIVQSSPGVYIPQGMNIAPIRQQVPVNQQMTQSGNRLLMGHQIIPGHQIVAGSFPQNPPQNLRY